MSKNNSNWLEPGDQRQRVVRMILVGLAVLFLIPVAVGLYLYLLFIRGTLSGFGSALFLAVLIIAAYGIVRSRWGKTARGWSLRIWLAAGFLLLAAQVGLAASLIEPQVVTPFPMSDGLNTVQTVTFVSLPPIVIVYAALLLNMGVSRIIEKSGQNANAGEGTSHERPSGGSLSSGLFILTALLLGALLYNLYWLAVWDSTTDALDYFWLYGPVLASVFAGILISFLFPWKLKWIGLCYGLIISALMIGVFSLGKQINFRQLTERRAARITQAIEAYSLREGRYPQQLSDLTPRYLLIIPSPVVIQGGNWCYQAGTDYYRFGYLDRDHWSSPILFGRVFSTKGQSPLKVDVCQQALDALRSKHNWDAVLKEYGQATPTPDLGE